MTRRVALLVAAWTALAAAEAAGAVPADLQTLTLRRAVVPAKGAAADDRWIEVREDSIQAHLSGPRFGDVRFMNDAGGSVPFVTIEPSWRSCRLIRWMGIPLRWEERNEDRELIVDLGSAHPPLLSLELMERESGAPPAIEGSDDRTHWNPVDAHWSLGPPPPPTRPQPPGASRFIVETNSRYVRLTRGWGGRSASPDSLLVYERIPDVPQPESVAFRVRGAVFRGRTWRVELDVVGPPRAIAAVVVQSRGPAGVTPSMQVEYQLNRGGWGEVYVTHAADFSAAAEDTVRFEPPRTRVVRLTVQDADPPNPPLAIQSVQCLPLRWVMPRPAATGLWLACRDPYLEGRTWEMDRAAGRTGARVVADLGPPQPNPFHHPPGFGIDWLRRRPAAVSAIMLVLLGLIALLVVGWRPRRAA